MSIRALGVLTVVGSITAALISIIAFGREVEPYMPATRDYTRAEIKRVSDSYADQLSTINTRLLEEAIQSATRELFEYKLKFKDDPDPLIQTRIKQIEDSIESMQEELDRSR